MLDVDQVDVLYGQLQAVWGVSISVKNNEIVTLIGANGAGKSTIVKTIAGLLHPARGKIIYDGLQLDRMPPHKIAEAGVTLVPEGRKVFSGMTTLENLEMGAYLLRDKKDQDDSLERVYRLFPILKSRARQNAETLSGGEQQMLAIGRGLMAQPNLMLLDEISQGLAPIIIYSLFESVKEIGRSGVSILLVEQNVSLALEIADRAYILGGGQITKHGDARTFINDEEVKRTYIGTV
jgi:branched-chain amino acid transport system ATP-binding protein